MPMVTASVRKSGFASLLLFSAALGGHPAIAAEYLTMPVACALGTDCAIAVYFDADPTGEARDYLCGAMTYPGHAGVDFAATDYAAMDRGIAVLAAAPGVVVAARDGVPDGRGEIDAEAVRNRECGNGIVIEHADGLFTQYCHLRQGSVTVLPGDSVDAGTQLGMIGQSGRANFPHVHFEVRQNEVPIDPFSGRPADGCGNPGAPLWAPETAAALPYFAGLPYHIGFAGEQPEPARIRAGDYDAAKVTSDSPFLVLWSAVWGLVEGDRVAMTIIAPDGTPVADTVIEIERTESWWYPYVGLPRDAASPWTPGQYVGEIAYTRAADGHVWTTTVTVDVSAQ